MLAGKSISIIIPAYNEEKRIGATLAGLEQDWIDEVIVVNDGSNDQTAELVKRSSVSLLDLKENQGKAAAVELGLNKARGEVAVLLDADLESTAGELIELVRPVAAGDVAVTVAVLPIQGGGFGLVRRLAQAGLQYLTGRTMQAPLSGQRVIAREVFAQIMPFQPGFGLEIGMDVDLIREGIPFQEINCNFRHRITGRNISGYFHRGRQFWSIVKALMVKKGAIDGEMVR